MNIHLISYADTHYFDRKYTFESMALKTCFFDFVKVFSPYDIDRVFYSNIYKHVRSGRGGGYWIWKPYFVKRVYDTIAENDLLIYCDVGCTINGVARKRFLYYIALASSSKTGTVDFVLEHKEFRFTKQEVFDYFNSPQSVINSNQLVGGILMLRKCPEAELRVNLWYDTAINHPLLFTDYTEVKQRKEFFDHRHDQSIFSVIRKTYGATQIPDETYFSDFLTQGSQYPFWATRLKG